MLLVKEQLADRLIYRGSRCCLLQAWLPTRKQLGLRVGKTWLAHATRPKAGTANEEVSISQNKVSGQGLILRWPLLGILS